MPGGLIGRLRFDQVFASIVYNIAGNEVRPDRDITNDGWTPEPIFEVIDEDDDNCVLSPVNPSNSSFEVGIGELIDFDKDKPVIIRFNFIKVTTGEAPASDGNTIDLTVEVKEGGTNIETFTYTNVSGYEPAQVVRLTGTGKDKITDPTKLSVKVTANTSVTGVADRQIKFCFLRFGTNKDAVVRAIENIDGSGQVRNKGAYVNLQGNRGLRGEDWEKESSREKVSPDTTVDSVIATRFGRYNYYSGDVS